MKSDIRILFIISSLGRGGAEKQMIELIKNMAVYKNFSIGLVVLDPKISHSEVLDFDIEIYIINRKLKKDPAVFIKLYKTCIEFSPDIIHSWESMATIYSLPVAKLLGIKLINGDIRSSPNKHNFFNKTWLRSKLTFPFSDCIVANSKAGLKAYNAPALKSVCIYNGFDMKRCKLVSNASDLKKLFNIRTSKIVGMVASFSQRKDYMTYFESALSIINIYRDVTFLTIGNGPTMRYFESKYSYKNKEKIKFLGDRQNVESIINIMDVGVLLTNSRVHGEGIPNAVMEYMALNKPVVVSDTGGIKELVKDGLTGFIVPPFDIKTIIDRIIFLLNNQEISYKMGKEGNKRISEYFNMSNMISKYTNLYYKLTL